MFIGSRQNIGRIPENLKINFGGNEISPSNYVKNLGVYFDRFMSFDHHIDETYKKTIGILIYLNRIKNNLTPEMRKTVVQSLALSHINYCCKVWGMTGITQMHRMQKLQNFAAKIVIGNGRKYDRATPIINKLQWLKVKQKCHLETCVFTYKIINGHLPEWLLHLTRIRNENTIRTRQQDDFIVPRTNTLTGIGT